MSRYCTKSNPVHMDHACVHSIMRGFNCRMLSSICAAQVLHSINLHQLDLIHSMDSYVGQTVMPILKNVKTMWQPSDFLPDSSSPDFLDQVCQHPIDEPPLCISTALLYACAHCKFPINRGLALLVLLRSDRFKCFACSLHQLLSRIRRAG